MRIYKIEPEKLKELGGFIFTYKRLVETSNGYAKLSETNEYRNITKLLSLFEPAGAEQCTIIFSKRKSK